MPANCKQNLDRCSQQIWGHDTFAHEGDRHSVAFNNGAVLTCTSKGANKPRNCTLDEPVGDRGKKTDDSQTRIFDQQHDVTQQRSQSGKAGPPVPPEYTRP